MATVKLNLRRGRYFAGVDIPFFVPNSAIRDAIEELGGAGVTITDREDAQLPFDPRIDPRYSDAWEEVITVDYPGPPKTIETQRRWKWLIIVPSSSTPAPSSPSSSTPSSPSSSTPAPVEKSSNPMGALVVLGVAAAAAAAGVALWRRRRR